MTGSLAPMMLPALSRLPQVELLQAGTWDAMTGTTTFTSDDLRNAVSAMDCPAVRRPILKLGHTDPRFNGEPNAGWVANLATADEDTTLLGDYEGMPGWLGPILASAYPDRSIEGEWGYKCQLGHTHPFVVHAVSLLGVTRPGVGTLESLQDVATMYGVTTQEVSMAENADSTTVIVHTSGGSRGAVALTVSTEDVRRAYYSAAPYSMWIEEVSLAPLQLIVCDDETGKRLRVPVKIGEGDGEAAVTFGTAVPVVVRYEDAPADASVAASAAEGTTVRYPSREASRPGSTDSTVAAAVEGTTGTQEDRMALALSEEQIAKLRELGLITDETADDGDALVAALTEALAERAEVQEPTPGTIVLDEATVEDMRVAASLGRAAHERQEREDREAAVSLAVASGRIPASRREHWITQLAADPGAKTTLLSFPAGLVPVEAQGYPGTPDSTDGGGDSYSALFGQTQEA